MGFPIESSPIYHNTKQTDIFTFTEASQIVMVVVIVESVTIKKIKISYLFPVKLYKDYQPLQHLRAYPLLLHYLHQLPFCLQFLLQGI